MKYQKNKNRIIHSKFSKSQLEVWEMKSKINERFKDLDLKNALRKILEESQYTTDSFIEKGMIVLN